MKVQELIDRIIAKCGVEPLDRTCDQVIEGDPQAEITGIVTTFMATVDVIREAYRVGANLIITHEPTYFTGDDERDWLAQDPVYFEKRQLLLQCGICVWRFHDYLHMATEGDGIYRGLLRELGQNAGNGSQYFETGGYVLSDSEDNGTGAGERAEA